MDPIKRTINELELWETTSILYDLLKEAESFPDQDLSGRLLKLWGEQIEEARLRREEAERVQSNVHIIFSLSDAGSLKVALSETGKREENKVLAFNESFSIGPIVQLDKVEGRRLRQQWMRERFSPFHFLNNMNREHQIEHVIDELDKLTEDKTIIIWCANNAHDQTGLRFVMHLLREHKQSIKIVNFTEILHDLPVPPIAQAYVERDVHREMVRSFHSVKPLSTQERQQYVSSWEELSNQNQTLRLWQDGDVKGCAENELDELFLSTVSSLQEEYDEEGFIRAGKVVAAIFENFNQVINDSFIEYRFWTMISSGKLLFRGLPGALYQYSIKLNE
ncbi:DUF1835 domain-containing protein [Paenibacillus lupini]|uniref:DUF1835 domain-containing protein n=1 Tax=Paenibacillus lupini TaxID=1450204 RepID=UPI00141DE71A|nr:DUF1835 domain-containing protein [Paenibacillus lupini]NIK22422.1 hypothetical protein [Paenibacillus lupini]